MVRRAWLETSWKLRQPSTKSWRSLSCGYFLAQIQLQVKSIEKEGEGYLEMIWVMMRRTRMRAMRERRKRTLRRKIPGDDMGHDEEDEDESDEGEEEEESEEEKDGSDNEEEESDDLDADDGDARSEEDDVETPEEIPRSKESKQAELELKPSKRTILEDKEDKPIRKLKVTSINDKLKRELGDDAEDLSESDIEEEDEEDIGHEINDSATQSLSSKKAQDLSDGVFHRRLTTGADRKVHSKVSEALEKITKKEEEEKEDSGSDSDEADEEDEEVENSDESDDDEEAMERDKESEDDVEEGGEDETIALNWKEDLAMKARDSFYARQSGTASLRRLVYGQQEDEEGEEEKDTVG